MCVILNTKIGGLFSKPFISFERVCLFCLYCFLIKSLSLVIIIVHTILSYKLLRDAHFRIVRQQDFFYGRSSLRRFCSVPLLLSALSLLYQVCCHLCPPASHTSYVLIHLSVIPGKGPELYTHIHMKKKKYPAALHFFSAVVFNLTYNKGLQVAVQVQYGGPAK